MKTRDKHATPPQLPSTCYFTVLELLAILAVLAVVASLLIPYCATAHRQASRTSCRDAMNQVGVVLQSYYKERANLPKPPVADGRHAIPLNVRTDVIEVFKKDYGVTDDILRCPTVARSSGYVLGMADGFYRMGYNFLANYSAHGGVGLPSSVPKTASDFLSPDKVLLTDILPRPNNLWGSDWKYVELTAHRRDIYPDGGHTLFTDGSVRWYDGNDVGPTGDGLTGVGNYDFQPSVKRELFWGVQ